MPEWDGLDALWGWPPPVLDPAGPYAESVTLLAWVLFGIGFAVTAIVVVALWLALRGPEKWRRGLGGEKAIWIGGVAFPGVVLTALLIWGLTLTASITRDLSGDEMRVRVTGHMWWFEVEYLGPRGEVVMRDANELHLPVGQPVVLELRSADVIHSFWVPNLSGKKDMIPGRVTILPVQADRAGRFGGVCAEYCGGPHALMGFVTVAHEAGAFREWLTARVGRQMVAQKRPVPGREEDIPSYAEIVPNDPRAGWRLFMDSGCGACHRIAGTQANGLAGPDLTYYGSRLTVGAGILPNNRGTTMGWIGDSQSIKPGNRMPSYDMLTGEELGHIAAFLDAQR